jgi:hypothetical protein
MPDTRTRWSVRPTPRATQQLDDLVEHFTREGLGPNQSQVILTAIDRLHAAVCRPATTAPKRPRTTK